MSETETNATVPFDITFGPAHEAVRLLADTANHPQVPAPLRERARAVVEAWAASLATPAQIAAARDCLQIDDDLELDDEGVCVSVGADDGFFIQTWSWVPTEPAEETCDACGNPTGEEIHGCPDGREICLACFDAGVG